MVNKLSELYFNLQETMRTNLKTGGVITHSVIKGDYTESAWINWFRTYLPKRYKVRGATIIDHKGNISDQIDIVIYDRMFSPPILDSNGISYITAESVYAVFEVKQNLNERNVRYAADKAESVKRLERTQAIIRSITGTQPTELKPIISGLVATESVDKHAVRNYYNSGYLDSLNLLCAVNGNTYVKADSALKIYNEETSLVAFLYSLLSKLQTVGSVSAIEYEKYLLGAGIE